MDSKVKLIDIAKATGLSIGTIDRALHNRAGINPQTRATVQAKAEELGFQRNLAAASLSRSAPLEYVAVFPSGSGFFLPLEQGIVAAGMGLMDLKVQVRIRHSAFWVNDATAEIEILDELIARRPAGLLIVPSPHDAVAVKLRSLREVGVPIVTMVSDVLPEFRHGSVTSDSFAAGQIAADLLAAALDYQGKVVLLPGFNTATDHQMKMAGFREAAAGLGLEIGGVFETRDLEQGAYEAAAKALSQVKGLNGIYVCSATAHGVARYLTDSGASRRIRLIGTDLLPEMDPYIESCCIQATLWQDPFRQGFEALRMLHAIASGVRLTTTEFHVYPTVVTKHNHRHYRKEVGLS